MFGSHSALFISPPRPTATSNQIRRQEPTNYANYTISKKRYAKFVYDAWTNPETLQIVSSVAGIALIPNMEYEIAHINISVPSNSSSPAPVVNWHKDSYPFVCVLMLSDATSMTGGETGLRTGTGELLKIRGPQMASRPRPHYYYYYYY